MVDVNAYVSRGVAPGFGRHWDDHDVLIAQLTGRKYWEVHQPTQLGAVRQFTPDGSAGEVVWSGILEPGSALFIPRGWAHMVRGFDGETSVHLTYGINRLTVLAALSLVDADRFGRDAIDISVGDLEHAIGEWRSRCLCLPRHGPIEVAELIDSGFDGVGLHVRLLAGAVFALDACTDDDLVIMANRRRVTLPRRAVELVAWLLEHPGSTIDELSTAVGRRELDPAKVLVGLGDAGLLQTVPLT